MKHFITCSALLIAASLHSSEPVAQETPEMTILPYPFPMEEEIVDLDEDLIIGDDEPLPESPESSLQ